MPASAVQSSIKILTGDGLPCSHMHTICIYIPVNIQLEHEQFDSVMVRNNLSNEFGMRSFEPVVCTLKKRQAFQCLHPERIVSMFKF